MGKIKKLWTVGSGSFPERGGPSGFGKMEKLWTAGARLHGIGSLFPVANSSPIARLRDSDTAGLPKHHCPVIITELPRSTQAARARTTHIQCSCKQKHQARKSETDLPVGSERCQSPRHAPPPQQPLLHGPEGRRSAPSSTGPSR